LQTYATLVEVTMNFRMKLLLALAGATSVANGAIAQPQSSAAPGQTVITQRAAEQLALNRVPQGSIKREQLEQRNNGLAWVIDVGRYNQPQYVTRVEIDAMSGKVSSGQPMFG
jgi:uncharacterized membrane protein YkoI